MIYTRLLVSIIIAFSFNIIGGSPYWRNDDPENVEKIDANIESFDESLVVGDMVLSTNLLKSNKKRFKREAYSRESKWPTKKADGTVVIPYTFNGTPSKAFKRAIEVFNAKTCIRFVPRAKQAHYVTFQKSKSGCTTKVGYQSDIKQQYSKLSSKCAAKKGKILHEMMHILGFLHEHCRSDRDNYITIHEANRKEGVVYEMQFAKIPDGVNLGIPYDCDSILHYKEKAFSKNSLPTITSSKCSKLGNDDTRLSLLDYKRVNKFYECSDYLNLNYGFFRVRIITNSWATSGTDCYIYMKLHGIQGRTSTEFELDVNDSGSTDTFERSSDDTFSHMVYRTDLGDITGISIRMVANGKWKGWKPNKFIVTDPVSNKVYTFTNKHWLYPPSTYGPNHFPAK